MSSSSTGARATRPRSAATTAAASADRAHRDRRACHRGMASERRLDFAELDAMAAHLDLQVAAPEVLQLPKQHPDLTREQKAEIVLAGPRGDRTVREICSEDEIAETLCYQWRDRCWRWQGGVATPRDTGIDRRDAELKDAKKRIAQLERALGRKTYEPEVAGDSRGTGRERPCVQSPRVIAHGRRFAVVARVAGISCQAIYRTPTR